MAPLMDKRALAEFLNVPVGWVERATAARDLPITWVGKHARYDHDDIAAWLADNKEQPAELPATLRLVPGQPRPAPPPRPAGPATPSKHNRGAA